MGTDATTKLIYGIELRNKDVMKIFKNYVYEKNKDFYKSKVLNEIWGRGCDDVYSIDDDDIYIFYMRGISIYDIIESIQLKVIDKFEGFKDSHFLEIPKLLSYCQNNGYEIYRFFLAIDERYHNSYRTSDLIKYLKLKNTGNFKNIVVKYVS